MALASCRIESDPALIRTEPREISGAEIICEVLRQEGVSVMFGYPGGAIMPFYDALPAYPELRHVLVRHEQAAAHAADGWARVSGSVGVCVATSGPGATNLVTGLATAAMDSVPLVAITGQVPLCLMGTDAFQETDVLGLTQAVTKHNFLIERVEDLAGTLHEAFALARGGRPGPVLVDIPKNVQLGQARYTPPPPNVAPLPAAHATAEDYQRAAELIDAAERPLIIAGHGVILAQAYDELAALAERADLPVVATLLGISAFPEDHPLYLGMPGMHGPAHVNRAISACDVLIGVGMRFDDRVTGKVEEFAPNARIVHVDIDPAEIGKVVPAAVGLVADARHALRALGRRVRPARHDAWRATIARDAENCDRPRGTGLPDPPAIFAAIREATRGEAIVVTDVGQHQMWAARFFGFTRRNSHITSGGLGTMGYALPAAMGARMARPNDAIWVIAGDGGFQMNLQELATIGQYGIEVKVAVLNNGYLGMVRQWQEFFHGANYSETAITGPDYRKLADAYGLLGLRVERAEDVGAAVQTAMATPGTVIIDFVIDARANVFPMVRPGAGINQMIRAPHA